MEENFFDQLRITALTRAAVYGLNSPEFQRDISSFLEWRLRENLFYLNQDIYESRIAEAKMNTTILVDALIGELRNDDRLYWDGYRHRYWANRAFSEFRGTKDLSYILKKLCPLWPLC